MDIFRRQLNNGMCFLYEHPKNASSWELEAVKELMGREGVERVVGDQCAYGHVQVDAEGQGSVKKPTAWMTNAKEIAKALSQRCPNTPDRIIHRHIECTGERRSKLAQVYPERLCREIVRGLRRQMAADGRTCIGGVGLADKIDEGSEMEEFGIQWESEFFDDASGENG